MAADDKKVKEEAAQILGLFQKLPRLVVFDLDYTLWPFYCECCYEGDTPTLFPHAKGIINALKDRGIEIAIASRSPAREIATTFLDRLGIRSSILADVSRKRKIERFFLVGLTRRSIFRKFKGRLEYHLSQCCSLMMRTETLKRFREWV